MDNNLNPTGAPAKYPAWVKFALIQGIVAPVLFVAIAIVGGLLRPGYSHISQAISELTEAGAVGKPLLDPLLLLMEFLTTFFGLGFLWVVRRTNVSLRISAGLLILIGVGGLLFYRYPMDLMGTEMTSDGRMHLVIVSVSALAAILSVLMSARGWAAVSGARRISRTSYIALAVMLVSGVGSIFVGIWGWPGIGVWQRVNTGAFSIWEISTVIALLRLPIELRR